MDRRLYQLFGELVGYPTPILSNRVDECISRLTPLQSEAAELMKKFKTFLNRTPLGQVEEIYMRTFDLQGICYPYVGYHLFGDGSHRGMFLSGLKEHYGLFHFSTGNELPDHLGVMLQFLAINENKEEREEFIFLCVVPALKRMLEGFEANGHPYECVLQALLLTFQSGGESMAEMITTNVNSEECQYER
jgi:nitrate reductase delta subunit